MSNTPREFRIFEVDKYGNRFFVTSFKYLETAMDYARRVLKVDDSDVTQATAVIQDEYGKEYAI